MCFVHASAAGLVNLKGLDIRIQFSAAVIRCASARFTESALPGFSEYLQTIDNESGLAEFVLLKGSRGGFSGDAPSMLVLTFEPVADGTASISVTTSVRSGHPLFIDAANMAVEADVDTATITVTGHGTPPVVTEVRLYQNHPNPFNPTTIITFDVPAPSPVSLRIFDVAGRLVRVLLDRTPYGIGRWEVGWNGTNERGSNVRSGVYFYALEACGRSFTRKMVLLR